jgi:hypothetical protein
VNIKTNQEELMNRMGSMAAANAFGNALLRDLPVNDVEVES